MKKSFSIVAILAIVIISFSSCNKCTTCTKSGGSISTICRNSYGSDGAYNLAVTAYENNGYNCN